MSTDGGDRVDRDVFVTGGTGYMGSRLIPVLAALGHRVGGLVRASSVTLGLVTIAQIFRTLLTFVEQHRIGSE